MDRLNRAAKAVTAAPSQRWSGQSRSRDLRILGGASAAMNATMAIASAVAGIIAADTVGTAWAGLPAACAIAGTGMGSVALSRAMTNRTRRLGLVAGYLIGLVGASVALWAATAHRLAGCIGLCIGMLVLGVGNASALLSRYAAADLYPAARRGWAIGAVVWSAALGAVGGPLLLGPMSDAAAAVRVNGSTAAMLLAAATCAVALLLSRRLRHSAPTTLSTGARARTLLRASGTRSALAVMAAAQVVMVTVMTSIPVTMHHDGASLGAVGVMLSGHTLGMFALAPLSGRLVDRHGPRSVMIGGLALLAVSFSALEPSTRRPCVLSCCSCSGWPGTCASSRAAPVSP